MYYTVLLFIMYLLCIMYYATLGQGRAPGMCGHLKKMTTSCINYFKDVCATNWTSPPHVQPYIPPPSPPTHQPTLSLLCHESCMYESCLWLPSIYINKRMT